MQKQTPVLGLLAAPLVLATMAVAQEDQQSAKLSFQAFQKWSFITPTETWTSVDGIGLKIQHPNGELFEAERDGLKLSVDTTGDGKLNAAVKGVKGFLVLRSKADGKKFEYAVRFVGSAAGYKFSTSGAMVGTVAGVPVKLIDLNNNGVYNEYGKDAMIVGKGKTASYLSKVISYKGQLFDFEVNEDGTEAKATPFDGDTGVITAKSGFKAKGKLLAAVISSSNGDISFNLTDTKSMKVPVGSYELKSGLVKKGSTTAKIRQGKMDELDVEAGKELKMSWGAKVVAEFSHAVQGSEVKVEPTNVKYYGSAGEEYYDFAPTGKSPKFVVLDAVSEKELGKGLFGT